MKRLIILTISLLTISLPLALNAQTPPQPSPPAAPPSLIPSPAAQANKSSDEHESPTLSADQKINTITSRADLVDAIGFYVMIVAIVWLNVASRVRQRRIIHETIRLMIEKGQPVPPELFLDPKFTVPRNDLRRGVIFIATGSGLIAFLSSAHTSYWAIGLIPILMGVGYLIVWKMELSTKNNGKTS